jgi:mevalonate kinase
VGAVVGRANAKLLLFGEHAAVYGHPAVGIALPQETSATLEGPGASSWNLDKVPAEDRETVSRVLARVEEKVPVLADGRRCSVAIRSAVARGIGFGSSAALCGSLARAALALEAGTAGENAERNAARADPAAQAARSARAWAIAHHAERLFHGTPSGVDTGLSLLGGTYIFRPRPPALPGYQAVVPHGMALVVGAVRRDEACVDLIAGLAVKMHAGDRATGIAMSALGELSRFSAMVLRSWGKDSPAYLGALADAAMHRLRALGLSTPELEMVLEAARRAGALGGKLSGAGGGGAFYAVAPDAAAAEVISRAIMETAEKAGVALPAAARVVMA